MQRKKKSGDRDQLLERCLAAFIQAGTLDLSLDHLAKQAGLETQIHKPDLLRPKSSPRSRPMTPEVILRELGAIAIGDILLETTDGRTLALRRVARPTAEPARILASLGLKLPERLSDDRVL